MLIGDLFFLGKMPSISSRPQSSGPVALMHATFNMIEERFWRALKALSDKPQSRTGSATSHILMCMIICMIAAIMCACQRCACLAEVRLLYVPSCHQSSVFTNSQWATGAISRHACARITPYMAQGSYLGMRPIGRHIVVVYIKAWADTAESTVAYFSHLICLAMLPSDVPILEGVCHHVYLSIEICCPAGLLHSGGFASVFPRVLRAHCLRYLKFLPLCAVGAV